MTGIKKSITSINVIRSGRGALLLCGSRLLTNNVVDKQEQEIWDNGGAPTPEASRKPVCLLSFLKLHLNVKSCASVSKQWRGNYVSMLIWKRFKKNMGISLFCCVVEGMFH